MKLSGALTVLKIRDDQPWMTHSIKQLIRRRQKLLREKKRDEYTRVAHQVSREIYKRKRVYFRRKFPEKKPKIVVARNDTRDNRDTAAID